METCTECAKPFPQHGLIMGPAGWLCHGCELEQQQQRQTASLVFTQGLTAPLLALTGSLGLVAVTLPGAAPLALALGMLVGVLALGAGLRTAWLAVFGDGYSDLGTPQRGALAVSALVAVPWSALLLLASSGGLVVWTLQRIAEGTA